MPAKRPVFDKFIEKICLDRETGCWNWIAGKTKRGYARFKFSGEVWGHRVSYLMFKGPIPKGTELDHTCLNKGCVNPNHVEPVTHQTNIARHYLSLTHCKNGHEYKEGSYYTYKTKWGGVGRWCKACFMFRHWIRQGRPDKAALVKSL